MQARSFDAVPNASSPFAANLTAALRERGMTQEALARDIGVSLRIVQEWCSGRIDAPRWNRLVLVAKALNYPPAWFLTDHSSEPTGAAA